MRFASFASGSSGNCSVLSSGQTHILIDAGISNKKIETRLAKIGLSPDELTGICVTHEHSDHIKGLRVFLKCHAVPVFGTEGTLKGIEEYFGSDIDTKMFNVIENDSEFSLGEFTVLPFCAEHDAADPSSFRITDGKKAFAIATDMGSYSGYTVRNLSGLDLLALEANHDVRMLEAGPYPYELKHRIASDLGHLSNETAGDLLAEILNENLKNILLCHLSRENNFPALAKAAVTEEASERLGDRIETFLSIDTAPRDAMSGVYFL